MGVARLTSCRRSSTSTAGDESMTKEVLIALPTLRALKPTLEWTAPLEKPRSSLEINRFAPAA